MGRSGEGYLRSQGRTASRPPGACGEGGGSRAPRPGGVLRPLLACLCLSPSLAVAGAPPTTRCPEALAADIPPRSVSAVDGTRFAAQVGTADAQGRERAIEQELLSGNVPAFLRRLKPVTLSAQAPSGAALAVTVCVMPDYLAVGSDADFLRVPMGLPTATAIASRLGFVLPTRKMVDAIHAQADARVTPSPMAPGPEMRSTAYYVAHDQRIHAQQTALGIGLGALLSGQKKDVVLTNLLARNPGRVAIYGWHRPDGRPIQPLSTVHGARYADYSHGLRLVSDVAYVNGVPTSVYAILEDPARASALSDEGPVRGLAALIPPHADPAERLARVSARSDGGVPEAPDPTLEESPQTDPGAPG